MTAKTWSEVKRFYSSPGFTNEEVRIFFATDLERGDSDPDDGEDLEVVEAPLAELDALIERCADAKTLVGLTMLRSELS